MSKTLYATFRDAATAESAVGALLDHGVRPADVSVISTHDPAIWHPVEPENVGQVKGPIMGYNPALGTVAVPRVYTDVQSETPLATPLTPEQELPEDPEHSKPVNDNTQSDPRDAGPDTARESEDIAKHGITVTTGADAERGAEKGAAWGVGVGIVAGLAALVVPGVGLVYGGGALALAILGAAGSTAAGAVAGALTGYLVDQGVEPHVAQKYAGAVEEGKALVAVTVPSGPLSEDNVDFLLRKYEAVEIDTHEPNRYLL